jgi:uncharacterized protein (TIGR02001 family)
MLVLRASRILGDPSVTKLAYVLLCVAFSSLVALAFGVTAIAAEESVVSDAPVSRWGSVTANATATSDFIFRGQTNTNHNPALQIGSDWTHQSGFYAGVWGTNVTMPGSDAKVEADGYGGWNYSFNSDVSAGLGAYYYSYYPDHTINTLELPMQFTWTQLKLGAAYAPHWGGAELAHAWYLSASWSQPLPWKLSLGLAAGWSSFDKDLGFNDYADFRTGLSREVMGVSCDLSEYFVNKRQFNGADDARTVFSLSKSI